MKDSKTPTEIFTSRDDITEVTINGTTFTFIYNDLLPGLSDVEYYDLRNNIAEHGVQVAIIIDEYNGVIEGNPSCHQPRRAQGRRKSQSRIRSQTWVVSV